MKRTALIVLVLSCIAQTTQTKKKIRDVSGSANKPPVILKFESSAAVVHTCEPAVCLPTSRQTVSLRVGASDPEGDALTYKYSANAGEIFGQGASVSWRLGDERPGTYSVTANVTDSKGAEAFATLQIAVSGCASCRMPGPEPPCPVVNVSASSNFTDPSLTYRGELLDFHVTVHTDAYFQTRPDYVWTVTNAKLLKGQHTPWIQVKTTGEAGETVTATVEVEGFDLSCSKRAEHSVIIKE